MRSYKAARRAAKRDEGGSEPIPFEVVYYDDDDQERSEVFNAYGEVSAATITDMGYFADLNAESPEAAAVIRRFFMEIIGNADEFRRFWRIAPRIDNDTIIEILGGLLEDSTGRPTVRPSDSPALSSTTGQDSKAVTLLPGGFTTQAVPLESSA